MEALIGLSLLLLFLVSIVGVVLWWQNKAGLAHLEKVVGSMAPTIAAIQDISRTVRENRELSISTHALVNSNMGVQLLLTARALAKVAQLTDDPADAEASKQAWQLLEDYKTRQEYADREKGGETPAPSTNSTDIEVSC